MENLFYQNLCDSVKELHNSKYIRKVGSCTINYLNMIFKMPVKT
jgi:uncharacterized protein YlbG (UPF0298 family)